MPIATFGGLGFSASVAALEVLFLLHPTQPNITYPNIAHPNPSFPLFEPCNPQPSTLNPQLSTLDPQPSTRNPQSAPSIRDTTQPSRLRVKC